MRDREDHAPPEREQPPQGEPGADEELADGDDAPPPRWPKAALALPGEQLGVAGGRGADRLQGVDWDATPPVMSTADDTGWGR
jgi:hypothetical protein